MLRLLTIELLKEAQRHQKLSNAADNHFTASLVLGSLAIALAETQKKLEDSND